MCIGQLSRKVNTKADFVKNGVRPPPVAPKSGRLEDHVDIPRIDAALRRKISRARVGHFATSDGSEPALVPVCFVLVGSTIYHAIDAKPKVAEPLRLRRVRNLLANPSAVLLVDHYDEDWLRLWWVLLRGRSRLLREGAEPRRAVAALRRKYPQYRERWPLERAAPVIALDVVSLRHWRSSSPGRRRALRPDQRA
ncbi:MAG: TIGR03668 family PPOX class F420-dependent oxidoreductase [Candidatus Dormibacteraeota bacterium]|nr:TIGR03668 family PPOX class F420-dependent oxidoreductase [Candidatus Dormibacteraeota bacterium]